MKKVEAIIQPHRLDAVRAALTAGGVEAMTVSEVRGFGRQKEVVEHYRGSEYDVQFLPKIKIEVIIDDDHAERVIWMIENAARSGRIGDGKVFVTPLGDVVRIRTGERGSGAA